MFKKTSLGYTKKYKLFGTRVFYYLFYIWYVKTWVLNLALVSSLSNVVEGVGVLYELCNILKQIILHFKIVLYNISWTYVYTKSLVSILLLKDAQITAQDILQGHFSLTNALHVKQLKQNGIQLKDEVITYNKLWLLIPLPPASTYLNK